MKKFNDENFLLQSPAAERLYHDHAAKMPIIDYHCHLDPEYVASDHRFRNLAEIWLDGDLMGVDSNWQYIVKGFVILLAVYVDFIRNKKAGR